MPYNWQLAATCGITAESVFLFLRHLTPAADMVMGR